MQMQILEDTEEVILKLLLLMVLMLCAKMRTVGCPILSLYHWFLIFFSFSVYNIIIINVYLANQLVNQRDEEITKIAKSIEELAQIFKELAVLVIDQGTILDRIDYNMENAVEHAKEGVKQLYKAEEHQKKNLAIKCIILLVILNIIMICILVWKHSSSKK
jgi:hypothetical protein